MRMSGNRGKKNTNRIYEDMRTTFQGPRFYTKPCNQICLELEMVTYDIGYSKLGRLAGLAVAAIGDLNAPTTKWSSRRMRLRPAVASALKPPS
jgi:hypothetical protein